MKKKLLCIIVIALFIAVQDTNCNEIRMELVNVNEKAEAADRNVKHQTDVNYFRAHGTGYARHKDTAKIKAQMIANSELSNTIQCWMNEFMSEYMKSIGQNAEGYVLDFGTNNKEALEKTIFNDIAIGSNEVEYIQEDGMYKIYLMIEIKRKRVFEIFNSILSTDNKWKGIYNQQKIEAVCLQTALSIVLCKL